VCPLYKNREGIAFPKGTKPSNVLMIFGTYPKNDFLVDREQEFIRQLQYYLKYDWYKTYAIKCKVKNKVKVDNIKSCRIWLKKEIKMVSPHLVVLMGKIPVVSIFGKKYHNLKQNIFYEKKGRKYFVGESIEGNQNKIDDNLDTLLSYIRRYYS